MAQLCPLGPRCDSPATDRHGVVLTLGDYAAAASVWDQPIPSFTSSTSASRSAVSIRISCLPQRAYRQNGNLRHVGRFGDLVDRLAAPANRPPQVFAQGTGSRVVRRRCGRRLLRNSTPDIWSCATSSGVNLRVLITRSTFLSVVVAPHGRTSWPPTTGCVVYSG